MGGFLSERAEADGAVAAADGGVSFWIEAGRLGLGFIHEGGGGTLRGNMGRWVTPILAFPHRGGRDFA